jgi:hypothetical protein
MNGNNTLNFEIVFVKYYHHRIIFILDIKLKTILLCRLTKTVI